MKKLRQISLSYFSGQMISLLTLMLVGAYNVRENKLGGGKIVLADIFNLSWWHG
jgi:hypothetical protein